METPAVAEVTASGKNFEVRTMPTEGVDFRTIDIDAHFREHLDLTASQVLKSLILSAQGELVMAVLPVAAKLNIVEVARAIGKKKGTLVPPDQARELTGLELGAIGPLGMKTPMPVIIDDGVLALEQVAVSAGSRGSHVVLAPHDLIEITGATPAHIVKE